MLWPLGKRHRKHTRKHTRGEIHLRKLWILEGEDVAYIREATSFPGIGLILRLDTEVRTSSALIRQETRYFISSLSAAEVSAEQLMRLVRGH